MPSNALAPKKRSVSDIKAALLNPSTTSHFEVFVNLPKKLTTGGYLNDNGINLNPVNYDRLNLMCCEATLPGSNLATLEITGDYTGVTERHAYRRVYDDRIDLTFYVDAEYYLPIRVFETWMKYIAQEASEAPQPDKGNITSRYSNYFYRFQYPDEYMAEGLSVTKFERSTYADVGGRSASTLVYDFIRTYPISITSMPVSYESSSLLKCTVSMTYIRYLVNKTADVMSGPTEGTTTSTPVEQSYWNSTPSYFLNPQFGVQGPQGTTKETNEYYNNFGRSEQDATNSVNFFNGRNVDKGVLGASGFA